MRGSKPGERRGGRQKGTPNKRTVEREQKMAEQAGLIQAVLGDAFTGDAHAYLMSVYKDPRVPENLRVDAAKAAIGYEKPKLSSSDNKHTGHDGGPIAASINVTFVGPNADGAVS